MSIINLARLLAIAWVAFSVWVFFLMLNGFQPQHALILLVWVALPLPFAYWIGSKLAATPAARVAVLVGLAASFALGAWLYWDAFLGPSSRAESLSGLIVLHGPLYQAVILAAMLLAAWLLNRPASA